MCLNERGDPSLALLLGWPAEKVHGHGLMFAPNAHSILAHRLFPAKKTIRKKKTKNCPFPAHPPRRTILAHVLWCAGMAGHTTGGEQTTGSAGRVPARMQGSHLSRGKEAWGPPFPWAINGGMLGALRFEILSAPPAWASRLSPTSKHIMSWQYR